MENFILYEELGTGTSSVVYKGRRKGYLNYVAIICADKAKRPEITNHVRLSHDLDHPNIVCFYEWYETSNHLWLVVELCTGGSLESIIGQDGCLSEDVVRSFGWDLVQGLKYIHRLGIIFSDLTPAKILLDGSGTLKFGNFGLSKADGEKQEDFFSLMGTSDEAGEEDRKGNFYNTRKRLNGLPIYRAPEVLQGSETNMSSDLWALGCTLYYMFAGKPPFYSESYTEITEMILHQEPPPPRQTGDADPHTLAHRLTHRCTDLHLFFGDEEWTVFLYQLCSSLEQSASTAPPPLPPPPPPHSTTNRSRLNLLCYLCCVVGHKVIANRLMNSPLLPVLTQQLRQSSNWDVRSKVLRTIGLLAVHCTDLKEDSPVSETVSALTDLLRENLRNSKIKQFLLPPLGEILHLIASQEKKRASPEGLWLVPAAAYAGLMRSLREGDDPIVHHMAAKAIENISTVVSDPSHHLVTTEIGSALWYLFTHSTVEAVRVTAISALSRLAQSAPAVIDTCGPAAILEGVGEAGARVQQHLLTAAAAALLTSSIHTHRVAQSKDLVLKVLSCLESPSTVTRAKAFLLLLLLIQDNTNTLLFCCQQRLIMHLERDLRKAAPLRENPGQIGYLSQCLDLLIVHLSGTALLILEDVLCALRGVTGRKHPSAAQSRELKHTLPRMSVVLYLISSQVTWALRRFSSLFDYICVCLSACVCMCVHVCVAPVEWSVFVLRVLSELSLVLLLKESNETEEDEQTEGTKERREEGGSHMLHMYSCISVSRYESLLRAVEPTPLYALRLLLSMTEHSAQICRLIKHSGILPTVFQLIMAHSSSVTSGVVQNAIALLCNLCGDTVLDLETQYQQGLTEVVVITLSEAALVYMDGEGHAGRKVSHPVLQALLELLHTILKQTSAVIRCALQLSTEHQEVWEESIQCLSLLVQLYGGEGYDCLSPSCLQSFSHVLHTHMHMETPRIQRTTLRIIKRLVSAVHVAPCRHTHTHSHKHTEQQPCMCGKVNMACLTFYQMTLVNIPVLVCFVLN
uniref:Protein kinase domain-containing protein n=1 Tax=Gasterosteus aculeatus aculeatus TaxID=481459 RepID=A0AAQ4QEC8_GASAC